jgi:23S rRNA (guanine2445-N2)-methyltransferase / 23S rRNA (guanine2069-N7)-methyltransferase
MKPKQKEKLHRLFAICPGGLDEVLKKEIEKLPATVTHLYPGGVEFEGTLETAYLANLKLRTASRVLLLLESHKKIFKPEELYAAVHGIDWPKVFSPESTFAIVLTESSTKERRIPVNPQFWALKAKDAVADRFTKALGKRPDVDRKDPDITLRLHLHDQILKIYLDLSGNSLHERGYRKDALDAPLKENLAAGLLLLSGWQYFCNEGFAFYDPFCGSGTLLTEAALIATRTAPGLLRRRFGFFSWLEHDPDLFESVHARVKGERILDPARLPLMVGSDREKEAVRIAEGNLAAAGLLELVRLKVNRFEDTTAFQEKGLLVMNPPYGVRLEEVEPLKETYRAMGSTLKHRYPGWLAGVLTSEKTLMHSIGLKPDKKWALHNGGLASQFSLFKLY